MPRAIDYGVTDVLDVVEHVLHLSGETTGDEYKISCPNPQHNDSRPSCGINLDTGYWSCFSCGIGGDIGELTRISLDIPLFEAQRMLKPTTSEGLLQVVQRRLSIIGESAKPKKTAKRTRLPGPYAPGPMDYMYSRGYSQATCDRWGIRYVEEETLVGKKGPFKVKAAIGIPIRDSRGHNLAWCYRSTDQSPKWQPKYIYSPGVELSDLWFGAQHHTAVRKLVVVEGGLDAMWCDQNGYPAWGMLGSKMGVQKILRLTDHQQVVLLADQDDAGYEWIQRVAGMVGTRVPLFIGQYRPWMLSKRPDKHGVFHPAKDPEELRPLDLEIVVESAMPYLKWKYL